MARTHPIICLGDRTNDFRVRGIKYGDYYLFTDNDSNMRWRDNYNGTIDIYNSDNPSSFFRIDKQYTNNDHRLCQNSVVRSKNIDNDNDFTDVLRRIFPRNDTHPTREYFPNDNNACLVCIIILLLLSFLSGGDRMSVTCIILLLLLCILCMFSNNTTYIY